MSVDASTQATVDGRLGEQEVSSPSRRRLIAAGAALGAAGLFLGSTPLGPSPGQADLVRALKGVLHLDPIVVNFALEMEELEKDFFTRVTRSKIFHTLSPREQGLFALIAREDCEHFDAINAVRESRNIKAANAFDNRNASASRQPKQFNFGKAFNSREQLYMTSLDIKETVLGAYHGAVDLVHKDTLRLAGAIAGVEGRHVTLLRLMNQLDPVPSPFEMALGAQAAGRKLARYGFRGGGPSAYAS